MMDWAQFWGITIALALAVFAVVSLVVAVGGFFDIRAMFQKLREDNPPADADPDL